jgi:hypothetical protein
VPWHKKKYKTQARMSVGGKGFILAREKLSRTKEVIIISDDEESRASFTNPKLALRRSVRLLGVKIKDYGEATPEPEDFAGDSDWEDDRSPGSWGKMGAADDKWPGDYEIFGGEDNRRGKGKDVLDEGREGKRGYISLLAHNGCCPRCRADIADLRATLQRTMEDLGDLRREVEYLDRLVEDEFKFLLRNTRKLFAMYRDLRRQEGVARARACTGPTCRPR